MNHAFRFRHIRRHPARAKSAEPPAIPSAAVVGAVLLALLLSAGPLRINSAVASVGESGHDASTSAAPQPGVPLETMWVVARDDGTAVKSSGLTSVMRMRQGVYEARFTQNVRNCAYIATIGDPDDRLVYQPGLIFASGGHVSSMGVYIETKNLGGGLTDFPFHLEVACSNLKTAVVNASGNLVRGSAASARRLGSGRYEVTFAQDVSKCAFFATIGDTSDKLVFNLGLVFTAGGHLSKDGVYVETKNLGGGLSDFPFHLAVDCPLLPRQDGRGHAVVKRDGSIVRANGPWQQHIHSFQSRLISM